MLSWSRSFVVAIKAIAVGIAFAILGIIIMIVGGVTIYEIYRSTNNVWAAVVPGIPIMIIGFALGSLGFYAALVKFITEESSKEIHGGTAPIPPSQALAHSCPNCRTPLVWVEQYKRWYCPNCKQYVP